MAVAEQKSPRKAFYQAQKAMESGRLEEAEKLLNELIAVDAEAYEAILHRSLLRLRLQKSNEALMDAEICVKLKPENALSFMVKGECHLELKQFQMARDSFLSSLALEKDNGRTHFGLGLACLGLGRKLEAADSFEEALHFERDYVTAQWMARGHLNTNT